MFNFLTKESKRVLKFKKGSEQVGENIITATIKLHDLIEAVVDGVLVDYENNRGDGKLNKTKVYSIAEKYDPNKLGVVTIADWENGTYQKADAHHRIAAIMVKYWGEDGVRPFTQQQLEQNVPLHIITKGDFIRVYSGLNANNGHSQKAKVINPDLGLGSMLLGILDLQEEPTIVKKKFHTAIARCVYAYIGKIGDKPLKELTYAEVSLDKKSVSNEAGLSKEEYDVVLSTKQKEEVAEAIDYVNELYGHYANLNNISTKKDGKPRLNTTGRSIVRNASLFGFILWDRLSERQLITKNQPKTLAYKITEKDAQIERQAKFLLNSELRDGAADKLVQYITTKKRV